MKHFSDNEVKCKCCGVVSLAEGFSEKLDELREMYGRAMYVNSGCRCSSHNKNVGGNKNSSHMFDHPTRDFEGSYGIDIRCRDSVERAELIKVALLLGWCVGVNRGFLHLDRRRDYFTNYPQVVFLY
jgi:hypothetical protein